MILVSVASSGRGKKMIFVFRALSHVLSMLCVGNLFYYCGNFLGQQQGHKTGFLAGTFGWAVGLGLGHLQLLHNMRDKTNCEHYVNVYFAVQTHTHAQRLDKATSHKRKFLPNYIVDVSRTPHKSH